MKRPLLCLPSASENISSATVKYASSKQYEYSEGNFTGAKLSTILQCFNQISLQKNELLCSKNDASVPPKFPLGDECHFGLFSIANEIFSLTDSNNSHYPKLSKLLNSTTGDNAFSIQ